MARVRLFAGSCLTISGEFSVPFLVLVMNHEHNDSPRLARTREITGFPGRAQDSAALHAHEADAG
jgi:hypothetical protein